MGFADFTRAILKNNKNLRDKKFEPLNRQEARRARSKGIFFENEKTKQRMELLKQKRKDSALLYKIAIIGIASILLFFLWSFLTVT